MIVFKGRVFSVEVERVRFPNGRAHEVAIVRHPPSVVLLPMQADNRVILIRQYRPSIRSEIWELPAGSVEEDESPETAAVRECEEEIGLVPGRVESLAAFYPTPGYCDEEMIYFRVADLHPPQPGSPHTPDDDEDIHCQSFTVEEARALVARGEIVDLKTAFGLTLV